MEFSNIQIMIGAAALVGLWFIIVLNWGAIQRMFQPTAPYRDDLPHQPRKPQQPAVTIDELDQALPNAPDRYKAECLRDGRTIYEAMYQYIAVIEDTKEPSDFLKEQRATKTYRS